jgi:hypothetical protein
MLHRPANLCILVGRDDNPMPQLTISPSQGLRIWLLTIWLLLSIIHKRWLQVTQYELQVFLRFCFGGGFISYFSSAQEGYWSSFNSALNDRMGFQIFLYFCLKGVCGLKLTSFAIRISLRLPLILHLGICRS